MQWREVKDIKYTFPVKSDDFEGFFHTIASCYRANFKTPTSDIEPLLFEHGGSYYILEDENPSDFGFNKDWYRFVVIDYLYYHCIIKEVDGIGLVLIPEGNRRMNKFLYFYPNAIQWGYYIYNETTKRFVAQVLDNSDPVEDVDASFERLQLYKSSTLTGVYEWQGGGSRDNIAVGWKTYTHEFEEKEYTATESVELDKPYGYWNYSFNGQIYEYQNNLPLSDFTMNSTTTSDTIDMTYKELVSLSGDLWRFDGGVQDVG